MKKKVKWKKKLSDGPIAATSLETLENEINELTTVESEFENIMAYTGIVLMAKSLITEGSANFAVDLGNYLQNKRIGGILTEVK
jgi:hypothetical protein